ncbi:UNVERIFIED_CONTAM: cohesin domain-containing protein [Acetivibrio alkalicellulosi]
MKQNRVIPLFLTILLLLSSISTNLVFADTTSSIEMELDKTTANVGDIIKATIRIKDITNFSGYQLNIKYDPEVLEAVNVETGEAYDDSTMPQSGDILANPDLGNVTAVSHSTSEGILNFGNAYQYLDDYIELEEPEETGVIAVIGFKVLQAKDTEIKFVDTDSMPNAITGTQLFDWESETVTGYKVIQPEPIKAVTATSGEIAMDLDKTLVEVGDIIKATIRIKDITNFSGYQLNIKYDPEVLEAVNVETGEAYDDSTMPQSGDILANPDLGNVTAVSHSTSEGILNFGNAYQYLEDYIEINEPEETGVIAVIGFKVLQAKDTEIKFVDTDSMPNAITGTQLFDWESETVTGYKVIQPEPIKAVTATSGEIAMDLDKTLVEVGDIIKATIRIKDITNFSGYQLNIKYDPEILEAVNVETGEAYDDSTMPQSGDILSNPDLGNVTAVSHSTSEGILNFGNAYQYLEDYIELGEPEETGVIAVIGFKVLQAKDTEIKFVDTDSMPNAITGTQLFDWESETIFGYRVIQPEPIKVVGSEPPVTEPPVTEPPVTDRATSDRATSDRATSDRATSDRATSDRATSDRATSDRATSDRATSDRATSDGATSDGATSDRATSDRATSDGATSDRATSDRATSN